jgi:hypothetical protein
MKPKVLAIAGAIIIIIFIAYSILLVVVGWPADGLSWKNTAEFGDSFGSLNAFFTGVAFLLILWTISIQRQELQLQKEEMSKMVAAQQRSLHMELLKYSLDDQDLAKVWGEFGAGGDVEIRQFIYVNLILSHLEMFFRQNMLTGEELRIMLDDHMLNSAHFRKFWEKARDFRKELSSVGLSQDPQFHSLAEQAYISAKARLDSATS